MKNSKTFNLFIYFVLLICIILILGLGFGYLKTTLGRFALLAILIPALLIKSYSNYLVKNSLIEKRYWIVLLTPLLGMFFIDTQLMNTFDWYSNRATTVLYIWFLANYLYSFWKKPKTELA